MIKANKGEWSEIYTLLKLLGDKTVYAGDDNLNIINDLCYPIISIFRKENNNIHEYSYSDNKKIVDIKIDDEIKYRIPIDEIKKKAEVLFNNIKELKGASFEIPVIEEFLSSIECYKIKAKSQDKTDITIRLYDIKTSFEQKLGFSIKSMLGSPSTLLNAGRTTNFIYKIENINLSDNEIEYINSLSPDNAKVQARIKEIINKGGSLCFKEPESSVFESNLTLVDSLLPQIMSDVLLMYYSGESGSSLKDITEKLQIENPLNFNIKHAHKFYEYKIKRLLTDIALGMVPGKVWTGIYEANGGYLIVKKDGDVVCYHIYDKNNFENYLLSNTRLDTGSTTRHEFGTIYKKDNNYYINLNLQIRFK